MRLHGWERKRARNTSALSYVYFKGTQDEQKRWLSVKGLNVESQ
jgi:hypothetical protein